MARYEGGVLAHFPLCKVVSSEFKVSNRFYCLSSAKVLCICGFKAVIYSCFRPIVCLIILAVGCWRGLSSKGRRATC